MNKSHSGRGYDTGLRGKNIAYHFFIGTDGTVKQTRSLVERTAHTRNEEYNLKSIAIVVAGDFTKEKPNDRQLASLRSLVNKLDGIYNFERIIGHKNVPGSPTSCPGMLTDYLSLRGVEMDIYLLSRYYTPVPNQERYYRDTYEQDFAVNCHGDCLVTADGYRLKPDDAYKVAACPPEMPFGTRLAVEGLGTVTCHDHGSAINGKRLDIWTGVGIDGLRNILESKRGTGYHAVSVE